MPPKPAPKLTKKELKQLAAQQTKKKEQQQRKRLEEEQEKQKQRQKLDDIQTKKRAMEQQHRIECEKLEFSSLLNQRLKSQSKMTQQLESSLQWQNQTTEYFKNYDVKGTNLSTFINIFRQDSYKQPLKSLQLCEQAELMVSRLNEQILIHRAEGQIDKQNEAQTAMREIHLIQMQKLQQIMIQMANLAEDMEQKNNQLARNKGQPNRRLEGKKLLEYIHYMSQNFKIGMFLNSTTTKAVNKFRPIQIKEFGLNTEIPSKWINANTIVKFQWVNFEPPFNNESNVQKQKHNFLIIGGVYNLEFYQLLMGSKKINNITLKKLFKGKEILQKFKLQTSLIKEPFQLQYQIPSKVFLRTFDHNSLQFAQYDFSINKWNTLPNDTVQEYDSNEKKVVLKVARPEPIAYIQSRCLDYPYIAWQLRTIKDDKVLLDIELNRQLNKTAENQQPQRLIVTFELYEDMVKLSLQDHYPQLADICDVYYTPEKILSDLSRRGIHLLPENYDYLEARLQPKDSDTEANAIRNIAYAVEGFYFRSIPKETSEVCVKIRENLDNEIIFLEDQEKDWKQIHWRNDRCWVSNRNIHEKHLNLEILLEKHDFTDKECLERIKYDRKYLLRKNIIKILTLTRILSFTSNKELPSRLREKIKDRILVK